MLQVLMLFVRIEGLNSILRMNLIGKEKLRSFGLEKAPNPSHRTSIAVQQLKLMIPAMPGTKQFQN